MKRPLPPGVLGSAQLMPTTCPRPVFVDDGFPPGQCQRRAGHPGLCDVYDGRDDEARAAKPWEPSMGVIDFNGEPVP
jgi:hypothetical protein